MTNEQWQDLLRVIDGEVLEPLPVGFIIDSPWLPGWAGMSVLDYYASEEQWFAANLKAVREFPSVMFLPGFWSEYGMCTEPSAFGAKCRWEERELPFAEKCIREIGETVDWEPPDPRKDGLAPFVLRRLQHFQERIEGEGHAIRFAVARGPLNVASFLMGTTELMMGFYSQPEEIRRLLEVITEFLVGWLRLQAETFPSIDGILVLDDIVGFLGPDDFRTWALPCLQRVFGSVEARVKFFHNDAEARVCAPHLAGMGVNLFNYGYEPSLMEMRGLVGEGVTLLGNIPPRDVLAGGSVDDIRGWVKATVGPMADRRRVIFSCGGGMPPGVSTENLQAFIRSVQEAGV